jgi:IS30 family transposase
VARREPLSFGDRAQIAIGRQQGLGVRAIAVLIGRDPSVVSRELGRNTNADGSYRSVAAHDRAKRRRRRPKTRKIAADEVLLVRVRADLRRSRTPRQIAGRLRREGRDPTVGPMRHSPPAEGRTVSHEAIYRYLYALPKGELAAHGIMLQSKRVRRQPRRTVGERPRFAGMVSIEARDPEVLTRRVPGHWEGDLIIGAGQQSAAATLVERTTRFVSIKALPKGKDAVALTDVLIDNFNELPAMMRKSLTWDQGSEMAGHAALTLAADLPVFFAHPRSPWERATNENTNRLIREYLPKGEAITDNQHYLDAIAEELNERPRAVLDYLTPREAFERLLHQQASVATTG